ncbi:(Fe-S)-binding protein [Dissulfurispira thermophila]|uniref:(Fe-S)-binding protein n=2 Tax=root TaxID=1 RepID=A0A7G1H1E7_9BACT|nr:4Fe-4S binding protein [Dissulfurispira thermophila]BCB95931.1 (Fe-S)-binding protein [Dissulfurispira thermophila]
MVKINRSYIRKIRYTIQWAIFLVVIYSGYKFYLFTQALENGLIPSVTRPPSVEGFMPIGALMALKQWITEGIFDPIHPAALVIFISALLLVIILKKSFCGWICPVGTLSEVIWKVGKKIFRKNFVIPKYIDYPLRSLKYALMAFFLYVIVIKMSPSEIGIFLNTPYWKVSDIKLLKFFTEMSLTTKITLSILFVLSLLYKNFWCRYLCPYGGLLGLLSILSPIKIRRNKDKCIKCGLCAKNCPSLLSVDKKETIHSPECTGCLICVSHCPAKDALNPAILNKKALRPEVFIFTVIAVFFGIVLIAKLTGKWHSHVSPDELRAIMPFIHTLTHP